MPTFTASLRAARIFLMTLLLAIGLLALPTAQPAAHAATTASSTQISAALAQAKSRVGLTPYRWGGTSLTYGVDCSGFTYRIFRNQGVYLPRTAKDQRYAVRLISRYSRAPGDLVFFHTSSGYVYHVGIYAGSGYVIDASSSRGKVVKRLIWTSSVYYGTLRR
jgi:cell wall-associated NlpC family hydrolase